MPVLKPGFVLALVLSSLAFATDRVVRHRGPWLGETEPGSIPVLFAPGLVSTGMEELNAVFSPDGRTMVYAVGEGNRRWTLIWLEEKRGGWGEPEVMPFSGTWSDVDAAFSPGGNRLWFSSDRPAGEGGERKRDFDLWYVDRMSGGWGEPVRAQEPVNSHWDEFYPCVVGDGSLYFQSRRPGGPGAPDIFRCAWEGDHFAEAVPLPYPVNHAGFQGDCWVSPDESHMVLSAVPEGEAAWTDLMIAWKDGAGVWGVPSPLGEPINSNVGENTPWVSPDGRFLFFSSRRALPVPRRQGRCSLGDLRAAGSAPGSGRGDVYWVDLRAFLEQEKAGGNRREAR